MNFTKSKPGGFDIKNVTVGELMAIRNGLGYAKQAGIITPVQREVFQEVGDALRNEGIHVDAITKDTSRFLKDHFNIDG